MQCPVAQWLKTLVLDREVWGSSPGVELHLNGGVTEIVEQVFRVVGVSPQSKGGERASKFV